MKQLWYQTSIRKEEFDDSVFNERETEIHCKSGGNIIKYSQVSVSKQSVNRHGNVCFQNNGV